MFSFQIKCASVVSDFTMDNSITVMRPGAAKHQNSQRSGHGYQVEKSIFQPDFCTFSNEAGANFQLQRKAWSYV